jgi:hypothetical protein
MFHRIQRALGQYHAAKNAEHKIVTEAELTQMLLQEGRTAEEAKRVIAMMRALRSEVLVGKVMYGLKPEPQGPDLGGGSLPPVPPAS